MFDYRMFGIIAVLIFCVQIGQGLIGYDCGSQSLNITTISLLDVASRDIPNRDINVTKTYIQLLQINDFSETRVMQCKLELRRTIYHCGMYSHVSIIENGQNEYIVDISKRRCASLIETGILNLGYKNVIDSIKLNQTTIRPVTLAGGVDNDGSCSGASYSDPFGAWNSVVVQGTIKVTAREQVARVDINSNRIHLRSGTVCTLSEGFCIDPEDGYTYWQPVPINECNFEQYGVLFEGYANKITEIVSRNSRPIYSMSSEDITFALSATTELSVCGNRIIRTEHPKLLIFETEKGISFANKNKISVNNLDIFAYVNSKIVYVEKHVKTQMKQLYLDVLYHRCRIEREALSNALSIATRSPDRFAYDFMKGPGYMAVTAGEVVHIIKCVPVEVKVEHGDSCYEELQVSRNNNTYFLTPRTHILKNRGTKITCSAILPGMFRIEGGWYKILPRPVETKDPLTIHPISTGNWKYSDLQGLATSGIYSKKDLDDLRDHIMFPVEQMAVLNDFVREVHGQPVEDKDRTIMKILNEDALENLAESTWKKLWNKFEAFGAASAGVIAVFAIIHGIRTLANMMINGYMLHQIYGFSLEMLGALWNSLARLLIYRGQANKSNEEQREVRFSDLRDVEAGRPLQAQLTREDSSQHGKKEEEKSHGFFLLT